MSARAAHRFRSQSEIAPQESPQGRRKLCTAQPDDEDAIWHSEMKRKGAGEAREDPGDLRSAKQGGVLRKQDTQPEM